MSLALTGLAAGLAGLFVIEIYFPVELFDHRPPANITAQTLGGPIGDSANLSQSILSAQRAVLLDRPLFNPSRRPAASHVQAMPAQIPRLSGIMITPNEKIAVFSSAKGGSIVVAQNSRLGAFTVLSITQDSVTVEGPNGVMVLRSAFSAQRPSGTTPPDSTTLPGGIDLSQINVPLPAAATWIGPPTAN